VPTSFSSILLIIRLKFHIGIHASLILGWMPSPTVGADEHKVMVVGKCGLACCMDCAY
jgi:hypothetical protein